MAAALTFTALLIELIIGYPQVLVRAIGHPVTWMGALIRALDHRFNRDAASAAMRRAAGGLTVLILITVTGIIAFVIAFVLARTVLPPPLGFLVAAILASTLLAQTSLHAHVERVAVALEGSGLAASRAAVSHIVGRDTAPLDAAGVARAAIESLAENFSDAVVAPAFWMTIGSLPGAAIYKAINTADSMIGHRTPRYAAFGCVAARLDDLVNWPAARLSALLIVVAAAITPGASAGRAWRAVWRDAAGHRSPNAGYPEAAMAGALGLKLAGPRLYAGVLVEDAMMGDGRREAEATDIRAALKLYRRADTILIALAGLIAAALIGPG